MSVATRNPFAILDEDNARPPSPPPPAPPPPQPAPQPSASARRARGGPAARAGRYYQRGGARQNPDREALSSEDPPVASENKQRRPDGERREGRGRGRGANRGRGRTFDRHSATGKTDSDKKIHNSWGGDDGNTELKAEEAAALDVAAESDGGFVAWAAAPDTAADDWGAPPPDPAPEQPAEAEKPDSTRKKDLDGRDNTLTLDQYLAQQKEKESVLIPKLEARKANEGAEASIWDGATRLEKGEGETYFSGKTRAAPKARVEKKEKIFLEIDARFERPAYRRSGHFRSKGRGSNAHVAVDVNDKAAFPTLS